jgi:undecaprenyl-diphosphatase
VFGKNEYTRVAWLIALATIPAVISGMLLEEKAESAFRSVRLVAFNFIVVALFMLAAEGFAKRYKKKTQLEKVTVFQALAVGVAQALAVIPGVSRSGSTITTGLFVGIDRVAATRFSFLLGIPIMCGAIVKVFTEDGAMTALNNDAGLFIVGIITALCSGLFAIRFMLKYLSKHSLAAFAYYRLVVGGLVLLFAIFG